MNIVLIGYMGSGKSLVGSHLAKKIDYKFIDLDQYIEKNEGSSISKIFEDSGDIYFRKIETKYLIKCLSENNNIILSLGGGTPCYNNNISLINSKNNISVYLKNTNIELAKRLFQIKEYRPLISNIKSEEKMIEFVSKHLFEREVFYNQATIKIDCYENHINSICKQIISVLN
jgi:shikimate kinase